MAERAVMEIADVREAVAWQADHAEKAGAPCTGRIVRAQLAIMDGDSEVGHRLRDWPRPSLEDALPLRLAGGMHHLFLTGDTPELGPVYRGEVADQAQVNAIARSVVARFDARLLGWLDGPPQTNEAGRSSSIMAGLLWLSQRLGPQFELGEIGASAGVNTMMERYCYNLGGVELGPVDSPMQLAPDWRGPPPPAGTVEILAIRGSDIAPTPLGDPEAALRLKAYVWADAHERMARIDAAIALAAQRAPDLVRADAGEWVVQMLARPQPEHVTQVLYHSVMWQYLSPATRAAITSAMETAGAAATQQRPLAWLALETNRATFRHELTVRYWPGAATPLKLAEAHPHGAWVHWLGTGV